MLLTVETNECGQLRVYCTQQASVVTYFAEDGDGGTALHVRPGEFACPWSTTPAKLEAVRLAVLRETAFRLGCTLYEVETHSMDDIRLIADPLLTKRSNWLGRSKPLRSPSR